MCGLGELPQLGTIFLTTNVIQQHTTDLARRISAYGRVFKGSGAEALDCTLLTRDARLARSSGHSARIEVQ